MMIQTTLKRAAVCCVIAATSVTSAWANKPWTDTTLGYYIEEKLEVGVRFTYFQFRDVERSTQNASGVKGGYAPGISTYTLKEEQSYVPSPYIRYNFTPYVGLQLAWERLEGRTGTRDVNTLIPYDHSNGNPVLSGPSLSVYGRYPIELEGPVGVIAPFASLGIVRFSGSFDHDADWHANGQRNMEIDDATGFIVMFGTSIQIYEGWMVDVSAGHVTAEPDARFWLRGDANPRAEWKFPMDSWLFQIGAKYAF